MRRLSRLDWTLITLAALVGTLVGSLVWTSQRTPERPPADRLLAMNREWLAQTKTATFQEALWLAVSRELPDDMRYVVQALQTPIPIEPSTSSTEVIRLCDFVPRWDAETFTPRPGLSVADGYQALLSALSTDVVGTALVDYRSKATVYVPSDLGTVKKKGCSAQGLDSWLHSGSLRGPAAEMRRRDAPGETWSVLDPDASYLFPGPDATVGSDAIAFQVRRVKVLPFERAGWFSGAVLRRAFDAASFRADGFLKRPSERFWGPQGLLGMIPVAIAVVDTPSLRFSVPPAQAAAFAAWNTTRQSLGSLSVDGVAIEAKEGGWVVRTRQPTDLRILPNLEHAWIVAVISMPTPAPRL